MEKKIKPHKVCKIHLRKKSVLILVFAKQYIVCYPEHVIPSAVEGQRVCPKKKQHLTCEVAKKK